MSRSPAPLWNRTMTHAISLAALLTMMWVSAADAQSLGDVARKEEARRKSAPKAGKVDTNESLRGANDAGTASSSVPAPSPAPSTGTSAAQGSASGSDKSSTEKPDPRKDEAYWRGRISQARESLERARTFQEALQSRINALSADFTARDDPAQRAVVATNRQKAIAELERVTKEIADFEKAIRDIEEEARKAGVPPGWLR
jgi:hypothetical protein